MTLQCRHEFLGLLWMDPLVLFAVGYQDWTLYALDLVDR